MLYFIQNHCWCTQEPLFLAFQNQKEPIPRFPVNCINILQQHQMLTSHHPLHLSTFKVLFCSKTTSFGNFSALHIKLCCHSILTQHRTDRFKGFQTNKSSILLFYGRGAWETKPRSSRLRNRVVVVTFPSTNELLLVMWVSFWSTWPLKALWVQVGHPWLSKRSKRPQSFTSGHVTLLTAASGASTEHPLLSHICPSTNQLLLPVYTILIYI